MEQAFIVMQIGNSELDGVCTNAIVPAIKACGLDAKRVDKHNLGGLLKSEIIGFLQNSAIIVADVTNERPNCYLEIGYAMGIDKFRNLILTARQDHNQDSPTHPPGGPKVHFDLSGYDVLFWDPGNVPAFKDELEKRIRRRLAIIVSGSAPADAWDPQWIARHRTSALAGLRSLNLTAYTEFCVSLSAPKPNCGPAQLLQAAERAQIHTFGWPIGIVLHNEQRPRPVADGIIAEVAARDLNAYDYWSLRRNGDFYLLQSLFEDERRPGCIFYDTRIARLTEALMYCARLYPQLGATEASVLHFGQRLVGIKDRELSSAQPRLWTHHRKAFENEIYTETELRLANVDSQLTEVVKRVLTPVFELFDFYQLPDDRYEEAVNGFVSMTADRERRNPRA